MTSKAEQLKQMDDAFMAIVKDLSVKTVKNAGSAVENILEISAKFIDKKAKNAIDDFRSIYFENDEVRAETTKINDDVSDMVEELQRRAEMGEDLSAISTAEDVNNDSDAMNRMAISALQKKLEQIISFDEAIKNHLLPVLSSMQFEDIIRQRLEHIATMWILAISVMDDKAMNDFSDVAEQMGACLTSFDERRVFYPAMLDREPPAEMGEQTSLMDILF